MDSELKDKILTEEVSCLLCGSDSKIIIADGYDYEYWTSEQKFSFVQCKTCKHIYLNPRPSPESCSIIYPSNYYTFEGRHSGKSSKLIAFLKKKIIRNRLSFFRDSFTESYKILEIGCGDCSLLIDIKQSFPQVHVTGIDLSFTEEITEKCNNSGISLIQGRIEDASIPENYYDLVIMNQLIEHLWSPIEVLRKVNHSLTSTGMISIETVNAEGYERKLFREGLWGGYYFPRHLNLFSFASLKKILSITGFEVIKQYSLLAPINWTFSFHNYFCSSKDKNNSTWERFFTDKNPFCLAIFTLIDSIALLIGDTTSNQKTIAKKVSS